ncbi:MAG TPA: hypothetical protein VNE38_11640 [Ktedonobacteraceae bacterium]|nr:hypothetical protein [Ktedonobacteraceae bacterium]
MMNRDRISRNRTTMGNGATTLGLEERLERSLLYPISAVAAIFWPIGWLPGLLIYLFEKNRNVRSHALQSGVIFGVLSIAYAIVGLLHLILGHLPLIGFFVGLVLGLLGSIIFWVIIALAVWMTLMVWFRPNYRLPFVGRLIDNMLGRWV